MQANLQQSVNFRQTAQDTRAREDQVKNSAGGFVFKASDLEIVKRFLVLGTEGGSYYASEQALTKEQVTNCIATIRNDGEKVVELIVEISDQGRAVKNGPALFLLAASAALGNLQTRRAALNALPRVARTATHLFEFLEYSKQFRGWGRALKTAVGNWYETKGADALAYQMVKYRNRNGWTHRDVLRKAHPKGLTEAHQALYDWACHGNVTENIPGIVPAFIKALPTTSPAEAIQLLTEYPGLPWEALSTQVLSHPDVWKTLLPKLPMTALIRNLGRMSANGAIKPLSSEMALVVDRLTNEDALKSARIHPLSLFVAKRTYDAGHGDKGSLSWTPNNQVSAALEDAFYKAFKNVEPTNKRFLLALDVSGSMGGSRCSGIQGLSAAEGSGLMAMTTLRSEKNVATFGFSNNFVALNLNKNDNFDSIKRKISGMPFQGTDCAVPMLHAAQYNIAVDCFVIYTDNETWFGRVHPYQALQDYRRKMGINAKLVVVSMVANPFTIADPRDSGMLDVVGFDTNTPAAIAAFAAM